MDTAQQTNNIKENFKFFCMIKMMIVTFTKVKIKIGNVSFLLLINNKDTNSGEICWLSSYFLYTRLIAYWYIGSS